MWLMFIGWEIKNNWRLRNALNLIKSDNKSLMKCKSTKGRRGRERDDGANLPSEFDDFSASVCAANAFVRSNKSSWNCFESVVVVDKSTDLKILQREDGKKC